MVCTCDTQTAQRIIFTSEKTNVMKIAIYIGVIVVVLIVRGIIRLAKTNQTPPPFKQNPPYNNPSMKQPPPYVPPSENEMDLSDFLKTQKPSFHEGHNIFNTPPSSPSNPFKQDQSSFSNMSTGNTNSNMGAGSQSYYCKYCGKKFQTTAALKMDTCFKHPKSDQGLQKHVLYSGAGKPNIGF